MNTKLNNLKLFFKIHFKQCFVANDFDKPLMLSMIIIASPSLLCAVEFLKPSHLQL